MLVANKYGIAVILIFLSAVGMALFSNQESNLKGLAAGIPEVCLSYLGDSICDDKAEDCGDDYRQGVSVDECDECQANGFQCLERSNKNAQKAADQFQAPAELDEIDDLTSKAFAALEEYEKEPVYSQAQKLDEAKAALEKRKEKMLKLAEKDPEGFLNSALSEQNLLSLPLSLQNLAESKTTISGKIQAAHVDDFENKKSSYRYFIQSEKGRYSIYFSGEQPKIISGAPVIVSGYKLDKAIVARNEPDTFQVSMEEYKGKPEREKEGYEKPLTKSLVLLVSFQDTPMLPFSKEKAHDLIFKGQIQNFIKETSYGKASLEGDVYGWYFLPRNGIIDGEVRWPDIYEKNFQNFILNENIEMEKYDSMIILANHPNMGGGFASVGEWDIDIGERKYQLSVAWIGSLDYWDSSMEHPFKWSYFDFVTSHELGHNFGVLHANSWICGDDILYGECEHNEYGNGFDVMGYGANSLHLNAFYKAKIGWLERASIISIKNPGRYTLSPLELNRGKRAAVINTGYDDALYLEYRRASGFNSKLDSPNLESNLNGVFVNVVRDEFSENSFWAYPQLLDMTPDFYWSGNEATLNGDSVFTDKGRGVSIGPITKISDKSITFDVDFFDPQCVRTSPIFNRPWYIKVKPESYWGLSVLIHNPENKLCGESNYVISAEAKWKLDGEMNPIENPTINTKIPPKGSDNFYFGFKTPKEPGNYDLKINVTHAETGKTREKIVSIIVEEKNKDKEN